MSQRAYNWGPYRVTTGWDRPLQSHFLTFERVEDGDVLFSNLWQPDPAMSPEDVMDALRRLGVPRPPTLYEDLRQDMIRDAGNEITEYPAHHFIGSPVTIPTDEEDSL